MAAVDYVQRLRHLLSVLTTTAASSASSSAAAAAASVTRAALLGDPRFVVALEHVFDGVYALARDQKSQQSTLGKAGACEAVVALLKVPPGGVISNASVLEKCLRAVKVLCWHGDVYSTRDEANIAAVVACGICEGESSRVLRNVL